MASKDFDNTNCGILKKNDKGDNPARPDYKGVINHDGVDFWLSAWIKKGKKGTKMEGQTYMSLQIGDPCEDSAPKNVKSKPRREEVAEDDDDDAPF